ncbi:MAG TPA: AAA family ATPase [Candidatus Acidoferrales bacterium]
MRRSADRNAAVIGLQRVNATARRTNLLAGTGLPVIPRMSEVPQPPQIFEKPIAAPLEFLSTQISDEVKMDSPSYPFESLDDVALEDLSTFTEPHTALTFPANFPSPLAAYGLLELEETASLETALTPNTHAIDEFTLEIPFPEEVIQTEANPTEQDENSEYLTLSLPPAPEEVPEKAVAHTLLSFYGLNQQPFDVTPDPAYLYLSPSHGDALKSLKQGIEHFRGFMLLVAEPGMGKTTLLNKLMEEQTESARVVFLFQTQCSSRELLCFILNELEVDHAGMDVVAMHRALNQALLEEMLRGRRFVLVVDEAQNLQEPVLETIRLLSDFETTHSKLIQIVLAGQPQLAETLMRESLVQLRQRIAVLSSLKALTAAETAEYVDHRLRAAGWNGEQIFTGEALAQIAESSAGVPRSINNLSFNALLQGFQRGLKIVDVEIVKEVTSKLNLESLVRRPQTAPQHPAVEILASATAAEPVQDLTPAPIKELQAAAPAAPFIGPLPKPESNLPKHDVFLTGNLTEKVRSQGWNKNHEYRILVTLERDPFSGLPVAERYYCCSIYMDEAQAATLNPGKPVRIKIEQD